MTLREARQRFYRAHGIPEDGGTQADTWAPLACRDLKFYLPNFNWRRKALPRHDLHHILTNYPLTPSGEFQMSAWEFAAGRYPSVFSTLFCLPLVSLGAIWIPRAQFRAFALGRRSRTLYDCALGNSWLERSVGEVRDEVLPTAEFAPGLTDYVQYALLVLTSALLMLTPVLAAWVLYASVT